MVREFSPGLATPSTRGSFRGAPDETLLALWERGKWGTVLAVLKSKRRFWLKACAIITLGFLAGCTSSRPVNVKPVTMGIFEVVDCKSSTTTPMTVEGNAEKDCLADKPVVNEMDLRNAAADQDGSESGIRLLFTSEAGQRLKEISTRIAQQPQRGKLGFVIDHKLIMAATIQSPFSDAVVIRGHLSPQQASDLAMSLRASAGGR